MKRGGLWPPVLFPLAPVRGFVFFCFRPYVFRFTCPCPRRRAGVFFFLLSITSTRPVAMALVCFQVIGWA